MYPRVVEGVGISVNIMSPTLKSIAPVIQKSMEDAVQECYNDGKTDIIFIKKRMKEAKDRTIRKLFGT